MTKCVMCGDEIFSKRRKYCDKCRAEKNRIKTRRYFSKLKENGIIRKRYGIINCPLCGKEFIKNHSTTKICSDCLYHLKNMFKTISSYNSIPRNSDGTKTIAREMISKLGLPLTKKLHLHHLDLNPTNNEYSNFVLLSSSKHAKLHCLILNELVDYYINHKEISLEVKSDIISKVTNEFLNDYDCILININKPEDMIDENKIYKFYL